MLILKTLILKIPGRSLRRILSVHHAFGLDIPRTLEDACDPRRMALVVYDMQIGIIRQIKHGAEITAKVAEVVRVAREAGVRIFFMRHLSLPRELMGVFQWRLAMAWQRTDRVEDVQPWFLRDSPGFQIVPELTPRPSEAIFDKLTMSAFEGTPLDIALRDCGVIGIDITARHGADLGYIPIVIRDACGAGHQDAGERSMETLKFIGDAMFTTVDGFAKALQR
jgi:biuret amidohydrolase